MDAEGRHRVIMHVDLDAFFASVEQRDRSEWRGKPVIVGADPKEGTGRGVVSTCSYEAREFGIRSAMPISRAWKLCPQGIYVRPDFRRYTKSSDNIMRILRKHADKFERGGIDEAFLDVSEKVRDFEDAGELAETIKREVLKKEKLTCSVGVGPNKLVAKLASDYKKPFGTTVVKPEDVLDFIMPLSARKLPGIGPKTEVALNSMGIKTVRDLSRASDGMLVQNFGKFGHRMHEMSLGIDEGEVTEGYVVKSIGREFTFEEDVPVDGNRLIFKTMDGLVDDFYPELEAGKVKFRTVAIKVRYENFDTHTREKSLKQPVRDKKIIKKILRELAVPFLSEGRKIRLVGVRVTGLSFEEEQKTLKGK